MDSIEAPVVVGMSNYISILHVEKSGSPGLTPTSVFHQDTVESTCVSAQFLQTPTQYQLPGYRIVSNRPQFTPYLHVALLPYDTASVDQESTISTLLTTVFSLLQFNFSSLPIALSN